MGEERKSKFSSLFAICLFAGFIIYEIISGITGLLSTYDSVGYGRLKDGDNRQIEIAYITEMVQITHYTTIIPTGREHYYLAIAKDGVSCMVVRTSKSFIKEHFNSDGTCKYPVIATGKVKHCSAQVILNIKKFIEKIGWEEQLTSLNTYQYVDLIHKELSLYKLIVGIFSLIIATVVIIIYKKRNFVNTPNKLCSVIILSIAVVFIVLLLYLTSMD